MAPWLLPALKAVLPHVGTIISAAVPVFTRRREAAAAGQASLQQQQIEELQTAAAQNAVHVRELAAQLRATVTAMEQAATLAEAKLRRVVVLCGVALVLAVMALGVALVLLGAR
jgi:hypothetical protein